MKNENNYWENGIISKIIEKIWVIIKLNFGCNNINNFEKNIKNKNVDKMIINKDNKDISNEATKLIIIEKIIITLIVIMI